MCRSLSSLLLLLTLLAPRAAPAERPRRVVRGLDGQADLLLDRGRDLRGYPLRGAKPAPGSPRWLSSLEKARLDARRIARAPRLSETQKLDRLLAVARHRMPVTPDEEARYQRSAQRQLDRGGLTRLSAHAAERTGLCRERAFLLRTLLREAGRPARVRYGVLYDAAGSYLGGHAWVETRQRGARVLLDPSLPAELGRRFPIASGRASGDQALRVTKRERINGRRRQVRGVELPFGWLYLPTRDLRYR